MTVPCYMIVLFISCLGQQVSTTRQISLANRHFKIGAHAWPPLLVVEKNHRGENVITGPIADYLIYIKQARNCSFTIVTPSDRKLKSSWGHCNGPNNCTGLVGMVARNEVDFAINPFTLTTDRIEAVDFTRPVVHDGYVAVVIPVKSKSKMWNFIYPFTTELWLLYIMSIPMCLIAMVLIDFLCNSSVKFETTAAFVLRIALVEHSTVKSGMAKMYQQKIAIIVLVSSFMVLIYSYSGNLTAMMTKPQLQSPIRTLNELLTQSKVPWVIESDSFVETLMRAAPSGSLTKKLYERSSRMSLKAEQACYSKELVEDGTHGVICFLEDFKTLTANDFSRSGKCNYYLVQQKFLKTMGSLAIQVRHAVLCLMNMFRLSFKINSKTDLCHFNRKRAPIWMISTS